MIHTKPLVTALSITATLFFVGTAVAAPQSDEPLSAERQERLLDRFGEQGIDANADGILTTEEVVVFFADRPRGPKGGEGMRGKGRPGCKGGEGMRGNGRPGEMPPRGAHRGLGLLHSLDILGAVAPPETFTAAVVPAADTDADGQLSAEEWQAFAKPKYDRIIEELAKHHPELDADDNGTISPEELATFKSERTAQIRARMVERNPEADTDGNGTLSDTEFDALRAANLAERNARILKRNPEADLDGDGKISEGEAFALQMKHGPRPGARDGDRFHGKKGARKGWHNPPGERPCDTPDKE